MDVLQRMGPRTAPATAVPPLELCALATTENAATLRRRFRCWVGEITDLDTADDLALAVYEALANVVDHVAGEASFTLELSLSEDWLRVTVADGSALRPVVRDFEVGAPRGRGMRLVEAIAARWGVEDGTDGKAVWFELAARP